MASTDPDVAKALRTVSAVGWFAERSPAARRILTRIARFRWYEPGEALYLFGDHPNGIFGLIEGAFDVTIPRGDGLDLTIHRADPGFWIGDLAFFAGQTRLVSLFAAERTLVMHLPEAGLRRVVQDNPELLGDFYALTHINMATALRLLANLATNPSEARVAARLLLQDRTQAEDPDELRVPQAKLAEMVALSLPTLQRVLRRMEDQGLIEIGYGRIRLCDRPGLHRLSEGQEAAAGPPQ